jgi:hypothetical protein
MCVMTMLTLGKDFAFYFAAQKKMADQFRAVALRTATLLPRHQRVMETGGAKPPIAKSTVLELSSR